jgi:hypothetical protein
MQAITVLVMVDPTASQCIINPRILDSMWLEEIDCGPDSQVVIANMRMPAEILGQPGNSIARDGWDVSLQLQVDCRTPACVRDVQGGIFLEKFTWGVQAGYAHGR